VPSQRYCEAQRKVLKFLLVGASVVATLVLTWRHFFNFLPGDKWQ
jgi:hypothetical protein